MPHRSSPLIIPLPWMNLGTDAVQYRRASRRTHLISLITYKGRAHVCAQHCITVCFEDMQKGGPGLTYVPRKIW